MPLTLTPMTQGQRHNISEPHFSSLEKRDGTSIYQELCCKVNEICTKQLVRGGSLINLSFFLPNTLSVPRQHSLKAGGAPNVEIGLWAGSHLLRKKQITRQCEIKDLRKWPDSTLRILYYWLRLEVSPLEIHSFDLNLVFC